jgi:hypothetical protein
MGPPDHGEGSMVKERVRVGKLYRTPPIVTVGAGLTLDLKRADAGRKIKRMIMLLMSTKSR